MEYNPKVDYLLCKYLSNSKFEIIDEKIWKDIYLGEKEPLSQEQVVMLRGKNILQLMKNDNFKFSKESIKLLYYILAGEIEGKIHEGKLEQLVNNVNSGHYVEPNIEAFIYVLVNPLFDEKSNTEMAKIIHNLIQFRNGNAPTIFYRFQTDKITKLLDAGNKEGARFEIINAYQRTSHFNNRHKLITLDEIKSKILSNESTLKTKFGVNEFYIYGSFAKHTENEYSDLDVMIYVEPSKQKQLNNKYNLFSYLEEIIGIEVEGHVNDIGFNEKSLKPDMRRYLTKIF